MRGEDPSLGRRLVGVRVSLDTDKMKAEERAELDSYAAMSTQGFPNPHYLHILMTKKIEPSTTWYFSVRVCKLLLRSAHKLFVLQDVFRFSLLMDLLPFQIVTYTTKVHNIL